MSRVTFIELTLYYYCSYICSVDIPEAPPDYFSVVSTRIQDARRESDGVCSFLMKVMQTLLCTSELIISY